MSLLIEAAHIIDVRQATSVRRDVLIQDTGLLASPATEPSGLRLQTIPAAGLYLLPGLIDAHVHLTRPLPASDPQAPSASQARRRAALVTALRATMASATTTVRDLGDKWPAVAILAARPRAATSPRVITALSGITTATGYGRFLGEAVRDRADLLAAVRRRHERGAGLIKLFLTGSVDFTTGHVGPPHFTRDDVALAAAEARARRLPLAVHANGAPAIRDAILAGATTVEHGIFADDDCLRLMAGRDVFWVPTVTPIARMLAAAEARSIAGMTRLDPAPLRGILQRHLAAVARAFELGVKVVAGTDAGAASVPHGSVLDELAHFIAAGVTPAFALRSATLWAAEALGVGHLAGALDPGRWADLIAVPANPLDDITALRRPAFVICHGNLLLDQSARTP